MTLERRLQHAARELRELDIPAPPMAARSSRPARLVQAVMAPALFALGGLVVVSGAWQATPDRSVRPEMVELPAAAAPATAEPESDADAAPLQSASASTEASSEVPSPEQLAAATARRSLEADWSYDIDRELQLITGVVRSGAGTPASSTERAAPAAPSESADTDSLGSGPA